MGNTAAQAAYNFEYEGYTDWYLPSKDEMIEMHITIGGLNNNIGQFEDGWYWTSSGIGSGAWNWYPFNIDGTGHGSNIGAVNNVRPIRTF